MHVPTRRRYRQCQHLKQVKGSRTPASPCNILIHHTHIHDVKVFPFLVASLMLQAVVGSADPPRELRAASTFCSRDASTRQPRAPDLSGPWQPNHWLRHNLDTRNVESPPCYSIRPVGASTIPWTIHGRSGKTLTTPRRVWLRARRPTSCLTSMTKHCRYFQGIGVEECALGTWLHAE